jgi:hypothetical protein
MLLSAAHARAEAAQPIGTVTTTLIHQDDDLDPRRRSSRLERLPRTGMVTRPDSSVCVRFLRTQQRVRFIDANCLLSCLVWFWLGWVRRFDCHVLAPRWGVVVLLVIWLLIRV